MHTNPINFTFFLFLHEPKNISSGETDAINSRLHTGNVNGYSCGFTRYIFSKVCPQREKLNLSARRSKLRFGDVTASKTVVVCGSCIDLRQDKTSALKPPQGAVLTREADGQSCSRVQYSQVSYSTVQKGSMGF